ncbi:MAG: zinc-binding dehydrogenase [Rhodobacteraceae bacterium]|nr:zinc-binding dehydrogenase [Paracoccaceae bacterium]
MTLSTTMAGAQLTGHGGPEKLEWNDKIPVPHPGPGQVLVQVAAAGVNNTDINTRIGWYSADVTSATDDVEEDAEIEEGGWGGALEFPRIQGGDLCGYVVALGDGVDQPAIGTRVTSQINIPRPTPEAPTAFVALGSEMDGAFAQFCLCNADELFDVSASPLSDNEIAAMPCAHGTAWNLITRAGVSEGQNVLVLGSSGGVGLAAVQLANYLGAIVTGATSPKKARTVLDAGAAHTISRDDVPKQDAYDVVIDVVGGDIWPALILATKPGGHYAVSGAIAGPIVKADLRDIYLRDITIHGCSYMPRQAFEKLVTIINDGAIRPVISKTYPMNEVAEAQSAFLSKRNPGKLVLLPPRLPQ